MMRFYLIHLLIVLGSLPLAAQTELTTATTTETNAPATIYETEAWKNLSPGSVYQGSFKLNQAWNNNWPLHWMILGDHIAFTKVPEDWAREHYFGKKKKSRIYDPQHYLTNTDKEVLEGILKRHEKYSLIPIHLCIFGKGQWVDHINPEQMSRSFFANENAALMYYFVGDCGATTGFVKAKQQGPTDPDAEPLLDSFLVRTMFSKAASHAASLKTDPKERMYAAVAEVSRRMFWIEQELGLVKSTELLLEDEETETEEVEGASMLDRLWQQFGGAKQNLAYFSIGIGIAVGLMLFAMLLMIHRRFKVYHFPLYEGPKRLGAEFGASVGKVVRFKSAREAPQEQKKRLESEEI